MAPRRSLRALGWLVAPAACLPFVPALRNGWVNWDDPVFLLGNAHLRSLSFENLRWMLTTTWSGVYQPLPWLTYALDHSLWGLDPAGFHLTSILFHCANAALFFLIARRLLSLARAPQAPEGEAALGLAAFAAALLFAVHPLRVESVAWASERRDVVCGAFFLLSVLAYLRERESGAGVGASLALFSGALLSKATAVTLPVLLLILDVYPLRRLPEDPRRWLSKPASGVIREKIPYFSAAAAAGLLAIWAESSNRVLWTWQQHGLGTRLAQAAFGVSFYLAKTLFPFGLSPCYEMPADAASIAPAAALGAAAAALLSVLAWRLRSRMPGLLAAWLAYLAAISPVLGLLQAGSQIAADRYSYLSCLGWPLLAAGWLRAKLEGEPPARRASLAAAACLLIILAALSWRQTGFWRDPIALWSHALEVDPGSAVANLDMGAALADSGRVAQAAARFEAALRANPACVEAEDALIRAWGGEPAADAQRLSRIVETNPVCRRARRNWLTARAALGDPGPAIAYFEGVLRIQPQDEAARRNLERARWIDSRRRSRP